ncbi:MAG: PTS sugar transporter subunit IIA [Lachnospiraceae bacterium]|nr:PTS sugar transporter subunit IIA [Lachnospiraceae bacterium]GFI08742.1 PTS system mannose-specific EIIAB component [Lachnospiraceae bacterium]
MSEPVFIMIMNHGRFGEELIASAELIVGTLEQVEAVSLTAGTSIEEYYEKAEALIQASRGKVLILTDLFGGTPCNVAMMLREKYNAKVLCGVNLPMLIEAANLRDTVGCVEELAEAVLDTGRAGVLEPSAEAEEEEDWA